VTRDPIGESGGVNLYDYIDNSVTQLYDSFGLSTLTLTGDGDSTYTGDVKKDLDAQAVVLRKTLDKCCKDHKLACGINVVTRVSNNKNKVIPPAGGYNSFNEGKYTGGGTNILFTDTGFPTAPRGHNQTEGVSGTGEGVVIRNGAPPTTLSHEIGHDAGYHAPPGEEATDPEDPTHKQWYHNKSPDNIMNPIASPQASEPDCVYCKDLAALAK
jgi:hypothetical protein